MKDLSKEFLNNSLEGFESDPKNLLSQSITTNVDFKTALLNRSEYQNINQAFKVHLPDVKITDQKSSGRCWLFAVCNLMRRSMIKEYNLSDDFELSQPYLFFYDKLEKCNFFLENIIDTLQEDLSGRLLCHLLYDPTCDGGQWDMIVNVVKKYGIVPKSVYPESISTSQSGPINAFLKSKLREYAKSLRTMYISGTKDIQQLRLEKIKMMETIHHFLLITMGTPPTKFIWKIMQKDKKGYICHNDLTPQIFYRDFVKLNVEDYISIVNDPRNPYDSTLTIDRLGNVVEGNKVLYLNIEIDYLWKYAKKMLDNNEPVWFGCDVGKDSNLKKLGIMSPKLFNYELLFNIKPNLKRKERLLYGESQMTHAMVFTGYDIDSSEKPSKWRVENSWGEDRGDKGYDIMTCEWFDEYMYQVLVKKQYVEEKHIQSLTKKPIVLPPWDPMGSLA